MPRPTQPRRAPRAPSRQGLLPRPRQVVPKSLAELAGMLRLPMPNTVPDAGPDRILTGISQHSGAVRPGDLYVARPGARAHGADFAASARESGAVAALTDPSGRDRCVAAGLPALVHPDPQGVLGRVSSWMYGDPARSLTGLAVTGTNGKTTTAYLLEAGLRQAGRTTGLIGTVETRIQASRDGPGCDAPERIASVRSTPEAPELHALFAVMAERGVDSLVMEVSSFALAFGRVDGITVDVAGFTNLSQDHLDVHGDLESYFAAKAALFTPERARLGVVNVDDAYGRRLAEEAQIEIRTVSPAGGDADWCAERVRPGSASGGGPSFRAVGPDRALDVQLAIPGSFNVANALVAVAMLAAAGVPDRDIVAGLAVATVPGRMERFAAPGRPTAIVDYAHTPDAVALCCASVRASAPGRVLVVLGCGGDRDPGKRAPMGESAARGGDVVVVTDDNPRSEEPAAIRSQVLAGAHRDGTASEVYDVADRAAAIRWAVFRAGPEDTVLVLGKGHEPGQEIAGIVHPFDDRIAVADALRAEPEEGQP